MFWEATLLTSIRGRISIVESNNHTTTQFPYPAGKMPAEGYDEPLGQSEQLRMPLSCKTSESHIRFIP